MSSEDELSSEDDEDLSDLDDLSDISESELEALANQLEEEGGLTKLKIKNIDVVSSMSSPRNSPRGICEDSPRRMPEPVVASKPVPEPEPTEEPAKQDEPKSQQQLDEQMEAELDDLAEGLTDVQFAVKLRMRLVAELIENDQLIQSIDYIERRYQALKEQTASKNIKASDVELEACADQIKELKEAIETERQQNQKMLNSVKRVRTAYDTVTNQYNSVLEKRKFIETDFYEKIGSLTALLDEKCKDYVQYKKEKSKNIEKLNSEISQIDAENAIWVIKNAEIQAEVDVLDRKNLELTKGKEKLTNLTEAASESHAEAVEKIQRRIERQKQTLARAEEDAQRRQKEVDDLRDKLTKQKDEQQRMKDATEKFTADLRKLERENNRLKTEIKQLENDKEDARREKREAERKARLAAI